MPLVINNQIVDESDVEVYLMECTQIGSDESTWSFHDDEPYIEATLPVNDEPYIKPVGLVDGAAATGDDMDESSILDKAAPRINDEVNV